MAAKSTLAQFLNGTQDYSRSVKEPVYIRDAPEHCPTVMDHMLASGSFSLGAAHDHHNDCSWKQMMQERGRNAANLQFTKRKNLQSERMPGQLTTGELQENFTHLCELANDAKGKGLALASSMANTSLDYASGIASTSLDYAKGMAWKEPPQEKKRSNRVTTKAIFNQVDCWQKFNADLDMEVTTRK
eukprot:gnl/MRDRNA2_/MRDRNA2_83644_c0_seq1.p1 gnl/MRDRNA2_/MRDRNA2_83644_c0~~gnl/MRDRNA2_/MRDRNA2_83644_c0_seq1.p1  ORF type:complete len:187 (+),score=38.31 gnl/MRDRNA2_/MRDRNA2_83644_c0_seq1:100-660(+)